MASATLWTQASLAAAASRHHCARVLLENFELCFESLSGVTLPGLGLLRRCRCDGYESRVVVLIAI